MKVVIVGATKGIGRAVARELAREGHALCLLGRDLTDLERSARDLEIRSQLKQGTVHVGHCDLEQAETFDSALAVADDALSGFDAVVVTAGLFGTQEALENDLSFCARMLQVNFTNTVLFCEHARRRLMARGGGTLCVVSSVAGDRGRKPVVLYGASKAGLSRYLEGLDHRYRAAGLRTVCIRPGFVKTGMTAGLKPPPFAGEPERVARDIVAALHRGTPVVYTPGMWRWIMATIRSLPRFVMRRVAF